MRHPFIYFFVVLVLFKTVHNGVRFGDSGNRSEKFQFRLNPAILQNPC